jgi:3-deoxy-manno-octulosonate cytidylyltransferase (CMP-KDO synthetase)
MTKAVGIIPARWGSTRFPGKPLHLIAGKPLLQHVWERCRSARTLDSVIVATDDMRIAKAAFDWGAEVALTSPRHRSGTDRTAEVVERTRQFGFVVNIQGDEPLIEPGLLDRLVKKLRSDPTIQMVTAAHPFSDPNDALSPHQVKVVVTKDGRALYFSRAAIPYSVALTAGQCPIGEPPMPRYLRHQGIYGFRRDLLLQFVSWKPTPLERAESLEQLRALENGVSVHVLVTKHGSPGVDTPQDANSVAASLGEAPRKGAKSHTRRVAQRTTTTARRRR